MGYTRRQFGALTAAVTVFGAGCLGDSEPDEEDLLEVPTIGDPDADVTVTVYEDFGCPACGEYKLNTYPEVYERYIESEAISYEHRDFPIPADDWSEPVASAARSVQDQSDDETFFDFTAEIYRYMDQYSLDVIEQVADEVGVDGEQVRADADDVTYQDGLDADRAYGEQQGVEATPTVFVDGEHVEDWSATSVINAIEAALE